jgi:Holliday junction resolvase RusA-like endonuclease
MTKDRVRHNRKDLPAYQFVVYERPKSPQGKRKSVSKYIAAIKTEAIKHILSPILSPDIEVEICWATNARVGIRADIDNIIKPTLDALVGIAYDDDKKVRSVTSTLFDQTQKNDIEGYVEDFGKLFYSNRNDAVQIAIYSDSRLVELGGYDKIFRERSEEFDRKVKDFLANRTKLALQQKEDSSNS